MPSVARAPPFTAEPFALIGLPGKLRDGQSTIGPNHHGSYPAKWKETYGHSEARATQTRRTLFCNSRKAFRILVGHSRQSPHLATTVRSGHAFYGPLAAKSSDGSSDMPKSGVHFNKIIQILVGPQEKPVISHKSILIKIPFFKNCLRNEMLEAAKGQVKLPFDDPDAFSEVVRFAYWQSMSYDLPELYRAGQGDGVPLRAYPLAENFLLTVKVYILAEKPGMEALQNMAVDML